MSWTCFASLCPKPQGSSTLRSCLSRCPAPAAVSISCAPIRALDVGAPVGLAKTLILLFPARAIGFGRSGRSLLDGRDASDLPKNRLVARLAANAFRVDFDLNEETDDAKGHRQVVQSDEGLRVHPAADRREGCIRPHFCRRACGFDLAQR